MPTLPPLRILCFGDSLTSGWTMWHPNAPYATTLEARSAAFPDQPVLVQADGRPGDTASKGFAGRMRRITKTWDWIIMLRGTNDLLMGLSADTVFDGLHETWSLAQTPSSTSATSSNSAQILALTVPEIGATEDNQPRRAPKFEVNRRDVNRRILSHSAPRYHAFDFASALPYHALGEEERKKLWDDGVHLTADGYARMGEVVGDALVELLRTSG